jgi:hypothetical protein
MPGGFGNALGFVSLPSILKYAAMFGVGFWLGKRGGF